MTQHDRDRDNDDNRSRGQEDDRSGRQSSNRSGSSQGQGYGSQGNQQGQSDEYGSSRGQYGQDAFTSQGRPTNYAQGSQGQGSFGQGHGTYGQGQGNFGHGQGTFAQPQGNFGQGYFGHGGSPTQGWSPQGPGSYGQGGDFSQGSFGPTQGNFGPSAGRYGAGYQGSDMQGGGQFGYGSMNETGLGGYMTTSRNRFGNAGGLQGQWGGYGQQEFGGGSTRTSGQSFAGRGPKGYQRSDERIREEVSEVLARNPQLDASGIEVEVTKGEVILKGIVDDRQAKLLAENLAESIFGVSDITNQVRVSRGTSQPRGTSDDDTAPRAGSSSTSTSRTTR